MAVYWLKWRCKEAKSPRRCNSYFSGAKKYWFLSETRFFIFFRDSWNYTRLFLPDRRPLEIGTLGTASPKGPTCIAGKDANQVANFHTHKSTGYHEATRTLQHVHNCTNRSTAEFSKTSPPSTIIDSSSGVRMDGTRRVVRLPFSTKKVDPPPPGVSRPQLRWNHDPQVFDSL